MIKEPYNRILIVEDEIDLLFSVKDYFIELGFDVCASSSSEEAIDLIVDNEFDLLLFDIMLPRESGIELCKRIKHIGIDTPVVFLTALSSEDDQLKGILSGAVDYISKPFSLPVLAAKCEQIIRLYRKLDESNCLTYGPFKLIADEHELLLDGVPIKLENREFLLLECLMLNANITLSRDQILEHIESDVFASDRVVDTYVKKLRKKFGKYRNCIRTVRDVGYKFEVLS